ncbi:response regulator, partial [Natronoarchaeum mannanilyticum]|uniref:response regulator n=1 Tax=Natronoarchaeum mannanilyticum TaxID=926360 RepID=UPI00366CB2DB
MLQSSRLLLVGQAAWLDQFADRLSSSVDATVRTVRTTPEALDAVRRGTVDCVVTAYALDETTGVEVLRTIRAETETLPVVLGAASGSDAVASEAMDAGVTDYVAVDDASDEALDDTVTELLRRTERAVRSARRT